MRIAHTCLRYPPATGGVETYVEQLVKRTSWIEQHVPEPDNKASFDVRVLTSKMRTHGPISELDPELLLDDPPYVQRLHHMATPLVSYPRLQALTYYIGHHKPDIVHGHSFWYQPADTAARYAAKHNVPFILHPYYYEHGTREKELWQLYKKTIGKKTFAAADVVAVISPHEQSLIEKAGLPVKRFELLPPGIDTEKFNIQKINPFLKRGIKGQILLAVGRIDKGKGLDEAINALPEVIKLHPDTHLAIVGEDFGAKEGLKDHATKLGLSAHIHFLGKLNEPELIGAYQHATLLVHPSHYEAFGIVLAESLAAGTPVVARNTAAIPFVVPHNQAGLLFNTTVQLSQNILTLLANENARKELGNAGRAYIEQNFTWDKTIKKLANLYHEFRT